jgi:uncharacterized protein YceK
MKIILMLIVGLMLAGCGSMENHVHNRDARMKPVSDAKVISHRSAAVDAICACP